MVSNVDVTTTVTMMTRATAMTLRTLIDMTAITTIRTETMAILPTKNIDADGISKDACVDDVNHNDNN